MTLLFPVSVVITNPLEFVVVYATVPMVPPVKVELVFNGPVPATNSAVSIFDSLLSLVFAMCIFPSLSSTIEVGALKLAEVPLSINAL